MMHSACVPHMQLRAVQLSAVLPQLFPHAPQLLSSFVTFVHVPPQHSSEPAHVRPHAPQFATVVVETHVPLQHERPAPQAAPVPQRQVPPEQVSPAAHEGEHVAAPHVPPLQVMPVGHRIPHIPQLFGFVAVSTHPPEQQLVVPEHAAAAPQWQAPSAPQVSPVSHAGVQVAAWHSPATQLSPVAQRLPHVPQWVALVCVSMQPPEQQLEPPVHAAAAPQRHIPVAHASAVVPQSCPHIPHSVRDIERSMHAPPQQVRPEPHMPSAHAIWQPPPRQIVPAGQVIAQPPPPPSPTVPESPPSGRGPVSTGGPVSRRGPVSPGRTPVSSSSTATPLAQPAAVIATTIEQAVSSAQSTRQDEPVFRPRRHERLRCRMRTSTVERRSNKRTSRHRTVALPRRARNAARRMQPDAKLRAEPLTPPFHVVLVEPEIPPNTGSVARTCAATASPLHLVRPLGFRIDEHAVRRAGLDYWHLVDLHVHETFAELRATAPDRRLHLFSANARESYLAADFTPGDALVFGRESVGLPPALLEAHPERIWAIPTSGAVRSLNLSNAVAIVLYEALRRAGALDRTFRAP